MPVFNRIERACTVKESPDAKPGKMTGKATGGEIQEERWQTARGKLVVIRQETNRAERYRRSDGKQQEGKGR